MLYQRHEKKLFSSIALVCILGFTLGCQAPAFQGGIRVHTTEALLEAPAGKIDVSGVLDFGNLTAARSPHNGTAQSFEGTTGRFGLDDHTSAQDNATWSVTVNYSAVIFACGQTSTVDDVPLGGATFLGVCILS
jgi:hypothetical protein